ncbi:MAG: glycerol kinase GlpK [Pseudomonadota bacterium]
MRFILAIDQGTTSTTAMIIDENITIASKFSVELRQHYPKPGWVEHNPGEIWATVGAAVRGALDGAGLKGDQISAIGITNQRETTILWDRETGQPLHNAIVWQCRRTAGLCRKLKNAGKEELFKSRTGLVLDPYFSGTKIWWLLRSVDGLADKVAAGEVAFGTVDCYLLWNLTGGKSHATDPSNASRTLLYNIHDNAWDSDLCGAMDINMNILPEVKPNFCEFGATLGLDFLPDGIPIGAMAGDQQAALFGQACFEPGTAKCTYGTGAFLLLHTGGEVVRSQSGLLTSIGWQKGGETTYVLEGSCFTAGSAVQWLRDSAQVIAKAPEIETLALAADPRSGVLFVPALTGLGAPYWDPEARGAILGLTRQAGRSEIARAILEGIALQIVDLAGAMEKDSKGTVRSMKVDGGACENNLLMQIQADLLGVDIIRPRIIETTAAGAALMAGLTTEIFGSMDQILETWKEDRTFRPEMAEKQRRDMMQRWKKGVEAVRMFAPGDEARPQI